MISLIDWLTNCFVQGASTCLVCAWVIIASCLRQKSRRRCDGLVVQPLSTPVVHPAVSESLHPSFHLVRICIPTDCQNVPCIVLHLWTVVEKCWVEIVGYSDIRVLAAVIRIWMLDGHLSVNLLRSNFVEMPSVQWVMTTKLRQWILLCLSTLLR